MTNESRLDGRQAFPVDSPAPGKRARAPLWEPTVIKRNSPLIAGLSGVLFLGLVTALYFPLVERTVLTTARQRVEVVVVATVGAVGPDDLLPGYYRLRVRLPTGAELPLAAPQPQSPGTRLEVSYAKGRVSGRIWLDGPVRVLSTPSGDRE